MDLTGDDATGSPEPSAGTVGSGSSTTPVSALNQHQGKGNPGQTKFGTQEGRVVTHESDLIDHEKGTR